MQTERCYVRSSALILFTGPRNSCKRERERSNLRLRHLLIDHGIYFILSLSLSLSLDLLILNGAVAH